MAARSTVAGRRRQTAIATARRQYLDLLNSRDVESLENGIIENLLSALGEAGAFWKLPIKLSRVASKFLIEPRPQIVEGDRDGEIEFDHTSETFRIKLFSDGRSSLRELGRMPRYRFTYAHEVAHRFFFVNKGNEWLRVIDLVSDREDPVERIRSRRYLNWLEERTCNRIAARVLIPQQLIEEFELVDALVEEDTNFYGRLSEMARRFGVSRECLLVRIQDELSVKGKAKPRCINIVMVVSYSKGLQSTRSHFVPRIKVVSAPKIIEGHKLKRLYPGMEISKLGEEAYDLLASLLDQRRRESEKEIDVPLPSATANAHGPPRLKGRARIVCVKGGSSSTKVFVWGRLHFE